MKDISGAEARYLMGDATPVTSSILTSSSIYLSNPLFRDVYAQMGLKRDGRDLPSAYLIPEIQRAFDEVTPTGRLDALLAAERNSKPDLAQWFDARFVSRFDAAELHAFPEGTLGSHVRQFIAESGMEIDFMFRDAAQTDVDYLNKRRVQVHDIEHMVTGFDPSPVGEIALIVANISANASYFSEETAAELNRFGVFLLSTSLMRAGLHYPKVLPAYLEGIARARALGDRQRRPLFMIRWEEYFDWPVADIRDHFFFEDGLEPNHWAWTHDAARD